MMSSASFVPPAKITGDRPRKYLVLALTSAVAASAGAFGMPVVFTDVAAPAHADVLPVSPTDAQGKQRWFNPDLRQADTDPELGIEITEAPSTITVGEALTVAVRIVNNSSDTISTATNGLAILPKHAEAQTSAGAARMALAQDADSFSYFGRLFGVDELTGSEVELAPGESIDVAMDIPTSQDVAGGINIAEPGFYPIMLGVHTSNGTGATQRFLLSVLDDPDQASGGTGAAFAALGPRAAQVVTEAADAARASTEQAAETTPSPEGEGEQMQPEPEPAPNPRAALRESATPLSIVVPITAQVNIVPGETGDAPNREQLILSDESLADSLASGGEIATLVDNLTETLSGNEQLAQATCLAIDPQLADALARMSTGYVVSDTRPSSVSQKQRLRDSWLANDDSFDSTEGRGSEDAKRVLGQLRELAGSGCSVALPWANADLNAVAEAHNDSLMREAVLRGQQVLAEVLGVMPVRNVVVSPQGYISPQTASLIGWADTSAFVEQDRDNDQASFTSSDPAGAVWSRLARLNSSASSESETSSAVEQNALDDPSTGNTSVATHPEPKEPVRVLTADSTMWDVTKSGRFGAVGNRVLGVGYDAGLAQVLMEGTQFPTLAGYSSYDSRFDPHADSLSARSATSESALRLAVDSNNGSGGQAQPVLAMLPSATTDVSAVVTVLNTAASLLETEQAVPMGLAQYTTMDEQQQAQLNPVLDQPQATNAGFGAPFDDPTVIADTEVLRVRQQAAYIDDLTSLMVNDPQLALTPYGFSAPLRQDLLRALSYTGRNNADEFDNRVHITDIISDANRETLTELRGSVSLLPPGNVYTRISESSPLLIVARNGLPLPVNAHLRYSGPEDSRLAIPSPLVIPAKGSMTVSMTADLPAEPPQTNLALWLATNQDAGISDPVDITVQTRQGFGGASGLAIGVVIALAAILLGRVLILRRKKKARSTPRTEREALPKATQRFFGTKRRTRNQPPRRGGDKSTGDHREPS